MLYLLGGAARTGKTTIANAFLVQTGIPFFSLDFLMMGFTNGLPEYGVDSDADELLVAEQLWPVIRSMATAMMIGNTMTAKTIPPATTLNPVGLFNRNMGMNPRYLFTAGAKYCWIHGTTVIMPQTP